jgi:putative effector of murein hydrolase LrgA (UPF0299 family)
MTLIAFAVFLLGIAAYAQWRIADFVLDEAQALLLRMLLLFLGVAVGVMLARTWLQSAAAPAAIFFTGFGLVHLPAAIILFLKGQRGEGRT